MNERMSKKPERNYKHRLFRMIFSDPKTLLSLYNAVNDTNYTDATALEINTLDNVIYLNMKNDLSFVIDAQLSLYEHQSTFNRNIPLRDLFYAADLYEKITQDDNLYGSSIVPLPTPHFVTFYNGVEEQPERQVLRLSDTFEKIENSYDLELHVLVLNINSGYNEKLMEHCKTLRDYMTYVSKVRTYRKEYTLEEAVELAIRECINNDILADFLRSNQSEAKHMSIYEYDEEKHMKQLREEGRIEGLEESLEKGEQKMSRMLKLVERLLQDNRSEDLLRAAEDSAYRETLYQEYHL